jgi:hypothetical protein
MAFGRHWEWRGFGSGRESICARVVEFPAIFPEAQEITDRYLWVADSALNVKLRLGRFKLKRPLGRECGIEQWLEDPAEDFAFPLRADVLRDVAAAFGMSETSAIPETIASDAELVALFRERVRVVEVAKRRSQHRIPHSDIVVEHAQIGSPERCVSIGIEHEDRDAVLDALKELGLPGELRTLNYIDALTIWARGERILDR